MGHWKLWIAIFTALDTMYIVVQCGGRGKPNWSSSGHLRRCSMADTQIKSLSSRIYPSILSSPTTVQQGRYGDEELEQWHISFFTIVTNVNGSLEAVDCHIHSARYDMVLEYCRPPSKLVLIRSPTTWIAIMTVLDTFILSQQYRYEHGVVRPGTLMLQQL
eukprot:scaffold3283_cov122-Skeletonema_dohrnii-CCMP3373.AAC.1